MYYTPKVIIILESNLEFQSHFTTAPLSSLPYQHPHISPDMAYKPENYHSSYSLNLLYVSNSMVALLPESFEPPMQPFSPIAAPVI